MCAKERKSVQNGQPYPERNCVCVRDENMRTRKCVRVYESSRSLAAIFLGQAIGQRGGIITEAVTFLWFL